MQTRIQQIIYIILSLATLSGCISSDVSCDLSKDFLNTEFNSLIENIEKDYDIEIIYNISSDRLLSGVSFKPADKNDISTLKRYLAGLSTEIQKYPPDFIKKIGLRKIVLCKELKRNNFRRGGIANYKPDAVYYDFMMGTNFTPLQKTCIHHEIYHIFEKNIKGSTRYDDKIWRNINDPLFSYGNKSWSSSNLDDNMFYPTSGFVSTYAMTSQNEDRAELFGYLMTEEETYRIKYRCKTDEILYKKVEYIKREISEHCESMDLAFWDKIKPQKHTSRFFIAKKHDLNNTVRRIKSSFNGSDGDNKLQFDNNVSVEYVGVTSDPNSQSRWWDPNGESLAKRPYMGVINLPELPKDIKTKIENGSLIRYDMAFHIDGIAAENVHLFTSGSRYCIRSFFTSDGNGGYYSDFCNVLTVMPYEAKSIDQIVITCSNEAWTTKGIYKDGRSNYDIYNLKRGQFFLETFEVDGDIEVMVLGEVFDSTLCLYGFLTIPNFRLIVFLKNNEDPMILMPNNTDFAIPPQLQKTTFWLNNLTLDDIAKLELQTCPNESKTLNNISLYPAVSVDFQTDKRVAIE